MTHGGSSTFDPDNTYTMTIAGRPAASGTTVEVVNPATRQRIATVPDCTSEQLDEAIDAAWAAFPAWSQRPVEERQRLVSAIGDRLEQHAEEFMALLTREQGKPRPGAEWEVFGSIAWFREIAKQSLPDEVLEDTAQRRVVTRYTPLGVVGGITPWNFPILLAVWKIAPALVSGNCIVVKPSPFTPLCTLKLAELVADLLPPGVFSVVSGSDDLGRLMSEHPRLRKIAFTGSTETGKHVMASAAGTLKRITLELGGNDPAIVLPDVDPERVAPQLFWAAFQNNAQFCNSAKRLYIHEDVYDAVATPSSPTPARSRSATERRATPSSARSRTHRSTPRSASTSTTAGPTVTASRSAARSTSRQPAGSSRSPWSTTRPRTPGWSGKNRSDRSSRS